jgi:hypothetical protein
VPYLRPQPTSSAARLPEAEFWRTYVRRVAALVFLAWSTLPVTATAVGIGRGNGVGSAGSTAPFTPLAARSASSATCSNWSGYALTTGTYAAVTGTFTIPSITRYVAGSTVSEWVGIDGYTNASLIQAGVNEIPEQDGDALVEPWWEVLPAPQELATGIMAHAGNTVTVTLRRVRGTVWEITLTDDSNDETFTTDHSYLGPASTVEWVLEANAQANGVPTPLAPYTRVTFSNLAVVGPQAGPTRIVMVQNGRAVSTPSPLASAAFALSNASAAPPPPVR